MSAVPDKPTIAATGRGNVFDDVSPLDAIEGEMMARKAPPPKAPRAAAKAAPAAAPEPKPAPTPAPDPVPAESPATTGDEFARPARARAAKAAPARTASTPRRSARSAGSGRRTGLPQHVARAEATVPLQVKVPISLHWELKQAAAWAARSGGMTRAVSALITLYVRDAELVDRLIDEAESEGQTFGEWVHPALMALDDGAASRAVAALGSLYAHDAELVNRLIDQAGDAGQSFGEWVHDALSRLAEND